MTPTERIAVLKARLRARNATPAQPEPRRPPFRRGGVRRCSICFGETHTKPVCPFRRLKLWTDGDGIFIATTAAEARAIALDPIPDDMLEECDVPLEKWHRVTVEPLELLVEGKPVRWLQHAWIAMNGPGFLAINGELVKGRRWE